MKIRGLRWYIVGLLGLSTELNYLDRQALSVLAQTINDELHITTVQYSNITSAFLVAYTVMYAVSGRLVDWLGTRRSLAIFVSGWSFTTILHFFIRTPLHLGMCRGALGAMEPGNFPAGVKAVAAWFPMRERALAVGIFNAGTAIGAALAAPLVSWIALTWGWRYAFVATGSLGLLWVIAWLLFYRSPQDHPNLSTEELHLIQEGSTEIPRRSHVSLREIIRLRPVWACIVARMLTDPISYFFIFWTPLFLQKERGFDLAAIGMYSWIPFVALALGNIAGGAVPAFLIARGWSLNRSRKSTMFAASCVVTICCLAIARSHSPALAISLISAAMFCHAAWANITLPTELLPREIIGSTTGLAGAMGGVTGIVTQQVIGWTVEHVSFTPVFTVCSFMHLAAFAAVCLLAGEIGKVRNTSPHEPWCLNNSDEA